MRFSQQKKKSGVCSIFVCAWKMVLHASIVVECGLKININSFLLIQIELSKFEKLKYSTSCNRFSFDFKNLNKNYVKETKQTRAWKNRAHKKREYLWTTSKRKKWISLFCRIIKCYFSSFFIILIYDMKIELVLSFHWNYYTLNLAVSLRFTSV